MVKQELARKEDEGALTRLWAACFGDDEKTIARFWRTVSPRVFVARVQGKIASMVCALPAALVDEGGESHCAAYLYAVCTDPEFRGKGLCRGLTAYAEEALRAESCKFAALVPANEKLFSFYKKMGYQTIFYHKKYTAFAKSGKAKITKLDAEGYENLRQMQLYDSFLDYAPPLLAWQKSCGELYRVETEELACCAAAERRGNVLVIKELLPDCPEAAAQLAAFLRCDKAEVRTQGSDRPFGMAKALGEASLPTKAYLGLAFD